MPGHPAYESNANFPKVVDTIRKYKKEYKGDFLGRSQFNSYFRKPRILSYGIS
jgi:hypothetical protein